MNSKFLILFSLLSVSFASNITLPSFISSHMVLQSNEESVIWAHYTANESITCNLLLNNVSIFKQNFQASAEGEVVITLPSQKFGMGYEIQLSEDKVETPQIILEDIGFGEVIFCSGQSNMEFSVDDAFNATEEIADSANRPNLRMFDAIRNPQHEPVWDVISRNAENRWHVSGPDYVKGKGTFSFPSATCYFTGIQLYDHFKGEVPVGLVTSCYGGTTVEAWSSPVALADQTCGGTVNETSTEEQNDSLGESGIAATLLWNGQVTPFLKMRFSAALWYQGEANAANPPSYACRFPAMIHDWRKNFDLELPFYFVQLAPYDGKDYAEIRQAQLAATALPNVGYAVSIDIGDIHSPEGNIHPRRKQEVGRRLYLQMAAAQYGFKGVSQGPVFDKVLFDSANQKATLQFQNPETLHFHDTADCTVTGCCNTTSPFNYVQDGKAVNINFTIEGTNVVLSNIPSNVDIDYDWSKWPGCAIYNGEGGPDDHEGIAATPFYYNSTGCIYE